MYANWDIPTPVRFAEEHLSAEERDAIINICASVCVTCNNLNCEMKHCELHGKTDDRFYWMITFYVTSVESALQTTVEAEMQNYEVKVSVDPQLQSHTKANYGSVYTAPLVVYLKREAYAAEALELERKKRLEQDKVQELKDRARLRGRKRVFQPRAPRALALSNGITKPHKQHRLRTATTSSTSGMVYAATEKRQDTRGFFTRLYDQVLGVDYTDV